MADVITVEKSLLAVCDEHFGGHYDRFVYYLEGKASMNMDIKKAVTIFNNKPAFKKWNVARAKLWALRPATYEEAQLETARNLIRLAELGVTI